MQLKKRIVLGLTGGFGSGKTTVASIFRSLGADIIDTDKIAHSIIKPGKHVYRKIIHIFGKDILKKDKFIDRKKLGGEVFTSRHLLDKLNKITHPVIIKIIKRQLRTSRVKLIILDAPLLLEAGLRGLTDKLVVVKSSREQQIKRAFKKTNLSKRDIIKRIKYQMPLKDKVRIADFVIDNRGSIKKTKRQVEQIRRLLWKN